MSNKVYHLNRPAQFLASFLQVNINVINVIHPIGFQ